MWLSALEISEAQLRSVADWFCRHNYFCVWTEALIGMIFVAGQKLSAPAPVYCPSPLPSDARTYIAGNSTLGRGFKTPLISVSSFVPSSGSTIHFRFICWSQLDSFCRRILVYFFCLISIGLSLCDEAYKMKFWILKGNGNFSYLWKFEPDKLNSFGEILFEKPQNLQRMYEFINVLPSSNFAVFNCCYYLCYRLQRAETCTSCKN